MRRLCAAALTLMLPLMLVTAAACDGGSDDDDEPTATSSPAETAEPTSNGASGEIRSVDLESAPAVDAFIEELGGTYEQSSVLYADVTGDDIEDATIPVSSGGTLGDIGFIVVTLDDGDEADGEASVSEALSVDAREYGVSVSIEDGKLVSVEPVPGPDDPECCPSQIRTTTYEGDGGTGLTEESSVVEENPEGGVKTPTTDED
jgi:hypothetical protein